MAQRKTLNETQVEVLRWIADGCPSGVMDGDAPSDLGRGFTQPRPSDHLRSGPNLESGRADQLTCRPRVPR